MKATNSGLLNPVGRCQIVIPVANGTEYTLTMNNLPDISDTKSAVYNNEPIIGRSVPLYTYSHSGDRTISIQIHFFITKEIDARDNLEALRTIQSALYPREDTNKIFPYLPPPVCRISCGSLLTADGVDLCVVLQSCSVKFPTEVAWYTVESASERSMYCPYRFDVDTTWLVVYSSEDLPFQSRIIRSGR